MPESNHQEPKDISLFNKGANVDDDAEILSASEKGYYVDSQNGRPTKVNSHNGAISKIKGEVLKYANEDNRCSLVPGPFVPVVGNYRCIGDVTVLGHLVEFWVDEDNTGNNATAQLPFIRIDGWLCCQAKNFSLFPLLTAYPLQISTNDSCVGGEVCVTDNHIPPFVLNVEDMLKSNGIDPGTNLRDTTTYPCTQTYFNDFDIAKYQVQLNRPVDHPIFIELTSSTSTNIIGRKETHGANAGMRPGAYQYAIRFSNAAGDTALISEATPPIPVTLTANTPSDQFPGSRTSGTTPTTTPTPYNIHIRFRVSNLLDYDQVDVIRTSWVNGKAIGALGLEELVAKIKITPQEFSIIDFFDTDNTATSTLPVATTTATVSAIAAAKAIRYYNSRLYLMNITYESRDLTGKVVFNTFPSGSEMVAISSSLKKLGYKDIFNNVYKKSYFRGEKGGFASVFFDNNGGRSFALEVPNQTNVAFPERRDALTGESMTYSSLKGFVDPSNNQVKTQQNGGAIGKTFEVFDLVDAVTKPILGEKNPANVDNPGSGGQTYIYNILNDGQKGNTGNPPAEGEYHPTSDSDTSTFSHTTNTDPEVKIDAGTWVDYQPKGFAPNYYALGMELAGISTMPAWVKAFSIVRTAPAGRVLAQGQTFYNMDDLAPHVDIQKYVNRVYWQSPDTYSGIVSFPLHISPRISAGTLKAKFVSAMGFFSELYSGFHKLSLLANTVCDGMDIAHYCRILEDHGSINIDQGAAISVLGISVGADKYVSFTSWRNGIASPTTPGIAHSTFSMGYDGRGGAHRGLPFYLDVPAGIYATSGTSGGDYYDDNGVKDWHEPNYVVNLIDDNVSTPVQNITEYFETGTYVKTESIVSISDGATQGYYLVDERWEDCIPAYQNLYAQAQDNRFIYLRDSSNNEEAWINVTFKNSAFKTTVNTDISNNGFYVATRPDGSTVNVTGMYTHRFYTISGSSSGPTNDPASYRLVQIVFDQVNLTGTPYIPQGGVQILVKYDHTAPIDVFGGDTFIGEFVYSPVDAQYNDKADPVGGNNGPNDISFDRPMPYHEFHGDEQHLVIRDTHPTIGNSIQDNNKFKLKDGAVALAHGRVRQQLVSGILESRINTALGLFGYVSALSEGQFQEDISYVMRPYKWKLNQNNNTEDDKIYPNYYTLYPNEATTYWGYGGFRFLPAANADYSEISNRRHYSMPKVGFKEELLFCTEVLWSQQRLINKSNAPGLLTFPPLNLFDLGDETGAIKFAYDAAGGNSGTNLYAITEHGVALLLTDKRILTELTGAQLAAMGSSNSTVVQEAVWISKSVGMNDEWWRSKAEWDNVLYFTNKNSTYRFRANTLEDIGKTTPGSKYYRRLSDLISTVGKGYTTDVTAVYDSFNNEYWVSIAKHRTRLGYYTRNNFPPPFTNLYIYMIDSLLSVTPSLPKSVVAADDQIFMIENNQITDIDYRYLLTTTSTYVVNNQTLPINIWYDPTFASPIPGPAVLLVVILPGETYHIYRNVPTIGPPSPLWSAVKTTIPGATIPVWSEKTGGSWIGQFKYYFDRYTIIDTKVFGARYAETWELNMGYLMNGQPVEFWVLQASVGGAPNINKSKEFIRVRIAGSPEPQRVDFYDNIEQFDANAPQGTLDILTNPQFSLKDYGAYEQYIPRKTAAPRYRQQGRLLLFKIMHNLQSAFKIIDTAITFKNLK